MAVSRETLHYYKNFRKNILSRLSIKYELPTPTERLFTSFFGIFRKFFLVRPDFTKVEYFLNGNMENISIISKTFPEWQGAANFFNIPQKVRLTFLKERNTKQSFKHY